MMKQSKILLLLQWLILSCLAAILCYEIAAGTDVSSLRLRASSETPDVSAAAEEPPAEKLAFMDPNTATLEELMTVPGIGPKTAQAIIDEREMNGDFYYPEDLIAVKGIGEKKMLAFKAYFVFPIE